MDNEEIVAALDEVFDIQAILSGELDYYQDDEGHIVVTEGWHELTRMLEIMDEIAPYLGLIQGLLAQEDDVEL